MDVDFEDFYGIGDPFRTGGDLFDDEGPFWDDMDPDD